MTRPNTRLSLMATDFKRSTNRLCGRALAISARPSMQLDKQIPHDKAREIELVLVELSKRATDTGSLFPGKAQRTWDCQDRIGENGFMKSPEISNDKLGGLSR